MKPPQVWRMPKAAHTHTFYDAGSPEHGLQLIDHAATG